MHSIICQLYIYIYPHEPYPEKNRHDRQKQI
jgi:hypothetical protein